MQHKRLKHLLDFCLDVPCIAPVMAGAALYWTDDTFLKKIHWKVGHRLYCHNQDGVSKTLGRLLVMIFLVAYALAF